MKIFFITVHNKVTLNKLWEFQASNINKMCTNKIKKPRKSNVTKPIISIFSNRWSGDLQGKDPIGYVLQKLMEKCSN